MLKGIDDEIYIDFFEARLQGILEDILKDNSVEIPKSITEEFK